MKVALSSMAKQMMRRIMAVKTFLGTMQSASDERSLRHGTDSGKALP